MTDVTRNYYDHASFSRPPSHVAIWSVWSYQSDLVTVLYKVLREFHLRVRDKVVLLKPNLIVFNLQGIMNTHCARCHHAGEYRSRNSSAARREDRERAQAIFSSAAVPPFAGRREWTHLDSNLHMR